jgi:uncharacterized protein (DUF983 family)
MRLLKILGRSLALRCPVCGQGKLFRGYFRMSAECENCGRIYEREPGFFLGAIYFNYGLTSLVATVMYPVLSLTRVVTSKQALAITLTWVVLFPIWFFRYSRSLWLGFDEFYDPLEGSPPGGD